MALAADSVLTTVAGTCSVPVNIPIAANTTVWRGAAVGDNASGLARGLVAADVFMGFAPSRGENNPGAASAAEARVIEEGVAILAVTGVTSAADRGEAVYATADDGFTLTSTNNTLIGKVRRWIVSTSCEVHFKSAQRA